MKNRQVLSLFNARKRYRMKQNANVDYETNKETLR